MKSALIRVLFLLCAICVCDAYIETVSVIEGDSVTLHTDVTEIWRDDVIYWFNWLRLNRYLIAKISGDSIRTEGASRDRLKLDNQTGDLTITNIKTNDSGEYKLKIINTIWSPEKTFNVSVVSGVDEVKSVSLTVGDSVTLNTGTIIQRDDVIEWRFGDLNSLIAENNRKTGIFSTSDGPDGRFRDRLQLDYSTGSLTIRNIGTEHSGLYEAGIRKSRHTIHKSYNVTASGEITSALSVMEGYSVTLHTDLTEIQTEDLMQWMFEDTVLAEINKAQKRFLTHDGPDGSFRGRLKLDHQTRSLTIMNTRITDAGDYELKIISSRFIINRRITVTVIGVFGDAETVLVIEGKSVTLHTDVTEIQRDDVIEWRLNGKHIAIISGDFIRTEGASRDRLQLDKQTGDLKITNIRTTDSGEYKLEITSTRWSSEKTFSVSAVKDPSFDGVTVVEVMEGDSVVLHTNTEILKDDEILWRFNETYDIAKMKKDEPFFSTYDGIADGIFRRRLQLDHQTGNLIISDIRSNTSGLYEVDVKRRTYTIHKAFNVTVTDRLNRLTVKAGVTVTLESGVTEFHRDDLVQWRFEHGDVLAEINKTAGISSINEDVLDGRFRDRLKLDNQTGSLTITHTTTSDSGLYHLDITSDRHVIFRKFILSVSGGVFGDAETVSVIEGESVTLHTDVTEIQSSDVIEWRLNGKHIAIISDDDSIMTEGAFRVRLQLDKQTGDLKITNIKTTDSGEYKLQITSSTRGSTEKTFSVSAVKDPSFDGVTVVGVTEGDSVVLHTDAEMLKDDEILWRFRGKDVIAKMKKDEPFFSTYDGIANGIFRRRLHVNNQTGNLTISDIRFKTSGLYEVDIKRRTYTIHKAFNVTIIDRLNRLTVRAGDSVTLESGVTKLHRDDLVQWRFEHGDILAEINKMASTDDGSDGRFRGRLKLNDQTGSLTITHTTTSDSGLFHLEITSVRHVIFRKFDLSVSGSDVTWHVPVVAVLGVLLVLVSAVACAYYHRVRILLATDRARDERFL